MVADRLVATLFHNGHMMISAAAPADTWGISGPTFLLLYVAAAGLLILAAMVQRAVVFAGRRDLAATQLSPQQAAYLNGGDRLAIYASLGGLRAAGAVSASIRRTIVTNGPLPAGATLLDQAIYQAAGQRTRSRALITHPSVALALGQLRQELERAGLAPTQEQRRAARLFPILLLALVGLGLLRFIAGIVGEKPVALPLPGARRAHRDHPGAADQDAEADPLGP